MNWEPVVIALLGGGLLGSIVLGLMNRKNTSADTFQKLSNTVTILRKGLDEEIASRRADRDAFQETLDMLRLDYETRIKELEEQYESKILGLEMRVGDLEQERDNLLRENWRLRLEQDKKKGEE